MLRFVFAALVLFPLRGFCDGLDDAARARALLGASPWTRIVRIENTRAGRHSPYPAVTYALVFEFSDILWFYTGGTGTQSLSLQRGRLAADKENPGPLFRAVDPGFERWSWAEGRACPGTPPNACFIECLAAVANRSRAGQETADPRLLSYYVKTPFGLRGHTVLLFALAGKNVALDPERWKFPVFLPPGAGSDPLAAAVYVRGGSVDSARVLKVPGDFASRPPEAGYAALPRPAHPPGRPLIKV